MRTPHTPSRRRRTAATLAAAGLLGLAGCSGGDDSDPALTAPTAGSASPGTESSGSRSTSSSSPGADSGSGGAPALQSVPASRFSMGSGDYFAFDFSTGGPYVGLCTFTSDGVTCSGTADTSVPDLTQHFPGRPSAISAGADGLRYTFIEGVPPPPGRLESGHQVSHGAMSCRRPDAATLECSSAGGGFTVSGAERRISTHGTVLPEAGTEGSGGSGTSGGSGQPADFMGASGLVNGVRTGDGRLVTASTPSCDGRGILIHDSYVENPDESPQQGLADLLDAHPGSSFATPGQCPSLRASLDGARVYPVYTDFGQDTAALCRAEATRGGNARLLVNRAEYLNPC